MFSWVSQQWNRARVFIRHFPSRFRSALQGARKSFEVYQAEDYNGVLKTFRYRPCEHCGEPWSTYHCDLYLCEECLDEYGEDYFAYKARRVEYVQALARLQHQVKWYGLSQDDLDTHWWMMGRVWNDGGHWEYFMDLIRVIKDRPEAVFYFAQHDLDLLLAWQRYERYDPTGRIGRRIERRQRKQNDLMAAVKETLHLLRPRSAYCAYEPGEEFLWWDISEDFAEMDFEDRLYTFCQEETFWFEDEFEDFSWRQFLDLFWEMYPNLFDLDE
jgi:hypothetical protein